MRNATNTSQRFFSESQKTVSLDPEGDNAQLLERTETDKIISALDP